MAEHNCISEVKISKAQRRYKIGYTSIRHVIRATKMTTYYSRTPSLHLKGNWLAEAGFGTDTPGIITVDRGQLGIRPLAAE